MITPTRLSLVALVVAVTAACGSAPASDSTSGVAPIRGTNAPSGVVLTGPDLYEYGGTLLRYLYARLPGMQVDYSSPVCPRVNIRGQRSIFGSSDPIVYVDGARTANSCILVDLHTRDVMRVEVYPMGVTNQPGYEAHPNGLILVFIRDGTLSDVRSRLTD